MSKWFKDFFKTSGDDFIYHKFLKTLDISAGFKTVAHWGTDDEHNWVAAQGGVSQVLEQYGMNGQIYNYKTGASYNNREIVLATVLYTQQEGEAKPFYHYNGSTMHHFADAEVGQAILDDAWFGIEYRVKTSNPHGAANGELEIWVYDSSGIVTGHQMITGVNLKDGNTPFNHSWNKFVWGGNRYNTPGYGSPDEYFGPADHFFVDDIVIDSNRIGPDYFVLLNIFSDTLAPDTISDLAVSSCTHNSCTLTWTAPGDDDTTGTATSYDIRYSTTSITNDIDFNNATEATSEPTPAVAGTGELFTVTGLTGNTTYYFAIKASDEASNTGALSNVINKETEFLAFPGAEGMGAYSKGGRGGAVVKVTNLNDDGPGSFREAVTTSPRHYANDTSYHYETLEEYLARLETVGPRIVVFEVSGIINLESEIVITIPNLTIAGQTSPGGILVTGYQTTVKSHDVIMQHMRFRVGAHRVADGADPEMLDAFDIWGAGWGEDIDAYDIIIDHCSFSWGVDETFTISGGVRNTTVQWCIVSEGLSHAGHPKGEHSKGLLVSGKYNDIPRPGSVTLYRNYFPHNHDRCPLIFAPPDTAATVVADVVNNVSYNWYGGLSPRSEGIANVNWVHNYAKQGSESNNYSYEVTHRNQDTPAFPQLYVEGNIGSTRLNQSDPHWNVGYYWRDSLLTEDYRTMQPWETIAVPTTEMSYDFALETLDKVGATKPFRDSVDMRVIADFAATTGDIIDTIVYPDDFPVFQQLAPPTDNDNDGMADNWEIGQGLNTSIDDSFGDINGNGYTNIEEYLFFLSAPPVLSVTPDYHDVTAMGDTVIFNVNNIGGDTLNWTAQVNLE